MASPSTPNHGKIGALYVLRPNGFDGSGVNDLTWGAIGFEDDSYKIEVVIDGVGTGTAGVDTFKWRENGGDWTETVDITGAEQMLTLANMTTIQRLTFADDGTGTPHTLADQWTIGNLYEEATIVASNTAQITDTDLRLINPNATLVWTPTESVQHQITNYTNGTAIFSAAPGVTVVSGDNGYVPSSALIKVGYLIDWTINPTLDMAESSIAGAYWKEYLPGQAGGSGSTNGYFIATETLLNCLRDSITAGDKYFLLQLFNYDPDQDQTGDHINAWVTFTSFGIPSSFNAVVKETLNFQIHSAISFTANV